MHLLNSICITASECRQHGKTTEIRIRCLANFEIAFRLWPNFLHASRLLILSWEPIPKFHTFISINYPTSSQDLNVYDCTGNCGCECISPTIFANKSNFTAEPPLSLVRRPSELVLLKPPSPQYVVLHPWLIFLQTPSTSSSLTKETLGSISLLRIRDSDGVRSLARVSGASATCDMSDKERLQDLEC